MVSKVERREKKMEVQFNYINVDKEREGI